MSPISAPLPDTSPDTSVKVPHLVLGLLFLGAAATWALLATGVVDSDALPYLGPGLLVAAGVVGLAVSLATARRSTDRHEDAGTTSDDHPSDTMEDPTVPPATRLLDQHPTPDSDDGEPTAPLHRPEDHR